MSVDAYDCPVAGCDFNLSAVGPVPDDEPDTWAEEVAEHIAEHAEEVGMERVAQDVAERIVEDIAARHMPAIEGGLLVCTGCREILPTLVPSDVDERKRALREHWTAVFAAGPEERR